MQTMIAAVSTECELSYTDLMLNGRTIVQFLAVTLSVIAGFVCVKTAVDGVRRRCARLSVLVVGAGPIGLTAALIAGRSGRVSKLILYEESSRHSLVNRTNQVAFDMRSVCFLQQFGVDFDNMEGCWDGGVFFTRVAVFLEYLLVLLDRLTIPVDVRLNTKLSKDRFEALELPNGRHLTIACDGANSDAASILGLSDVFEHHSCGAYGAVAVVDRDDQPQIPAPEKRVHGLNFDMTAYGMDTLEHNGRPGFHLKIFGSQRTRYLSLCIPKCDNKLVKFLRVILNKSMMRNIFQKCFNTYKSRDESTLFDSFALKCMKYSPRLFEIRLSQREETVAYFEDCDMFVIAEGDSARSCNFHTGLDVNVGLRGLESLSRFIDLVSCSQNEHAVLEALHFKANHAEKISRDFLRFGLRDYVFS